MNSDSQQLAAHLERHVFTGRPDASALAASTVGHIWNMVCAAVEKQLKPIEGESSAQDLNAAYEDGRRSITGRAGEDT